MDSKLVAPHVARNAGPIAKVLFDVLPPSGLVLEIASGTGEHAARFARIFPRLEFQPTDPEPEALASIAAWREEAGLPNLRPPLRLDVRDADWPVDQADAILCCNMIHISPWEATLGLFRGAARRLKPGGPLFLYGPYLQEGVPTAPGNVEFDASLRTRNPAWGLRLVEAVAEAASAEGFRLDRVVPMPANNLSLVFRLSSG